MTATRLQRINYIKSWELDVPQKNLLFPAEKALVDQINKSHNAYFQPFAFPYNDHARYQYYLTFLIEALELLPLKVDLAFDSCWRGYESLLSEKNQCGSDKTKCLQDSCKSYSTREAQLYDNWEAVISRLFSLIPVQTCKYLIQRLFAGHASNAKHGETRINKRVEQNTSFGNVGALMSSVAVKYKAPESSLDELRKASLLLRKAFRGEYITVGSYTGQLDIPDRLYLLVLGVLYTFRNDRFHGNMQPPFKSSLATLQTYAHTHYLFLSTYFLFLQSLQETGWVSFNSDRVEYNLDMNMDLFESLYGKHLGR